MAFSEGNKLSLSYQQNKRNNRNRRNQSVAAPISKMRNRDHYKKSQVVAFSRRLAVKIVQDPDCDWKKGVGDGRRWWGPATS
jgi:hypothetical protein